MYYLKGIDKMIKKTLFSDSMMQKLQQVHVPDTVSNSILEKYIIRSFGKAVFYADAYFELVICHVWNEFLGQNSAFFLWIAKKYSKYAMNYL